MSRFHNRNFELLEPYDAKVSCTVLRGERGSNTPDLPDKEYYDALKSVHNLVKDARKVQKSILLIGEISDIYVNSFQKMLRMKTIRRTKLSAIALRIYPTVAGKFRCAGRDEKRGEHQRAFHVGQGTDGRYRPDV